MIMGATAKPTIPRSLDLTERVEFNTENVTLPGAEPAGTVTTICVGVWLTKVVTSVEAPTKEIPFTISRLVPVTVRFAPTSTGLGDIEVIAGNITSKSWVDTVLTPDAATKVTLPFCVFEGTLTTICVADWLTKFVTVSPPTNKIC